MELFDLYDSERNKTGRTMERGTPIPTGHYRMVVHVCVFGSDGKMLIQRRQPFKRSWSGMWDLTVGRFGGHKPFRRDTGDLRGNRHKACSR